jgi:coenzyme F420-reducing hydrogenase alpha subunit
VTKLIIEPLTRVEGHGRVELTVSRNRLQSVRVDLNESPRLFEAMLFGRDWQEAPELVCRICGICSAVHKLAALAALEQAVGISIPPLAAAVRELLLLGGHIQSHALHLFCLVLPDFFAASSVLELVRERNPLALAGLELKGLGNRLQELFGGRVVHPVNIVPGGIVQRPPREQLTAVFEELCAWNERWERLSVDFSSSARYPAAQPVAGNFLATGAPSGFALTGDQLWLGSGEVLPVHQYRSLLGEIPVSGSHAKHSAGLKGPFLVGALARLALAGVRGGETPSLPGAGIYDNNAAQAEEIGWALKRAGKLVGNLLAAEQDAPIRVLPPSPRPGTGTAAFEAPRGLLIHQYVLDDEGRVAKADVVTPTAINQLVMEEQIRRDLCVIRDSSLMPGITEQLIRAYDPCISCAVHLMVKGEK